MEWSPTEVLPTLQGTHPVTDCRQQKLSNLLPVETHGLVQRSEASLVFGVEGLRLDVLGPLPEELQVSSDAGTVDITDVVLNCQHFNL